MPHSGQLANAKRQSLLCYSQTTVQRFDLLSPFEIDVPGLLPTFVFTGQLPETTIVCKDKALRRC